MRQYYLSLLDPAQTPSGKVLNHLLSTRQDNGPYMRQLAEGYRSQLLAEPYQYYSEQDFVAAAEQSLLRQQQIEAADTLSFEQYLADYFREVPACTAE